MRASKKYKIIIKAGICIAMAASSAGLIHIMLSAESSVSEDDIIIDEYNICYVYDEPYYKDYVGTSPIPLMHLDKVSDEDVEEVLLSYPEHYPHTEYFEGPSIVEDDPRNPIGKWVGRGLAIQPHGWWLPHRNSSKCVVKTSSKRVDAPGTVWLALLGTGAMLINRRQKWNH